MVLDGTAAVLEAPGTPAVAAVDIPGVSASTRDPVCACLGKHAHAARKGRSPRVSMPRSCAIC